MPSLTPLVPNRLEPKSGVDSTRTLSLPGKALPSSLTRAEVAELDLGGCTQPALLVINGGHEGLPFRWKVSLNLTCTVPPPVCVCRLIALLRMQSSCACSLGTRFEHRGASSPIHRVADARSCMPQTFVRSPFTFFGSASDLNLGWPGFEQGPPDQASRPRTMSPYPLRPDKSCA